MNKKEIVKHFITAACGIALWEAFKSDCTVFAVCTLISILIACYIIFNLVDGKKLTKKGIIIVIAIISLTMGIGAHHRFYHIKKSINESLEDILTVDEIKEDQKEEEVEEPKAEETNASDGYGHQRGWTPEKDKIQATKENQNEAKTIVNSEAKTEIAIEDNSQEEVKAQEAIEIAQEEGNEVYYLEDDVVVIIPTNTSNETEETTAETVEVNTATDDELENMVSLTSKDEVKLTTMKKTEVTESNESKEVETTELTEDETPEIAEVETKEANDKTVEKVSVEAIDGYTTTVGSQIQFRVSGDDVAIDGLDGIDYSFTNGILTVDAGQDATVLTVEISNSVNTVEFDITVNGIIR